MNVVFEEGDGYAGYICKGSIDFFSVNLFLSVPSLQKLISRSIRQYTVDDERRYWDVEASEEIGHASTLKN